VSVTKAFLRVLLLLVPAAMIAVAFPQLVDGLAIEAAFPVPTYIQMNAPQSVEAYADAAASLDFGARADGDRLITEAEAYRLAGGQRARVIDLVTQGLKRAPSSARGWAILGELELRTDRRKAANAIATALELAPSNFLLSGRLLEYAGSVWDLLPSDSRQVAINITPNLWSIPDLRHYLRPVLSTPGGVQMLTEAFRDSPEDLRALNRFVADERLKDAGTR